MTTLDDLLEEVNLLHQDNKFQEILDLLDDAILEDSMHPLLYFSRGIAWSYNSSYDKAIEDFTKAITLNPDLYRAYQNRGITWNLLKKYDRAINDFKKTIELRPNYGSAYQHMGNALRDKKEYDKAIPYYDKAVELKPGEPQVYTDRGSAWIALETYDKALEDYNTAIALRPDNASSYTDRGNAFYGLKEYGKAIENYHRAIEMRPKNGRAYYGLGRVYVALEEMYTASMHYKRSLYLGFDKTRLLEIFRDTIPSPYIVKSLVSGDEGGKNLEANFATIAWLLANCKKWDSLFEQLYRSNSPSIYPEQYYRLNAIVNYYMGHSIAAYRLFDTKFDSDAYPYPLTLRDQYYLALSAMDFMEPDNGLAYAVECIKREDSSDEVDNYYAGWLLLLSNDPDRALEYFDKCADFIPALYGKIAAYKLLDNATELLRTADGIAAAEAASDGDSGFLNGIRPLTITAGMSFEEMFAGILRQLYYYELIEEIEVVRALLNRPAGRPHLEFKALVEVL